jgi:two-component system, cell cycle response regulator
MANILIVEDNPANLALMVYLLDAFGHTTRTATNGAEGVAAARAERPDLVLMDLQMPKVDGYDAAEQMRAIPHLAGVPVVAVTASAMVGDRDAILARGFQGYIAKPILPEAFLQQIERFLQPDQE